MLVTFAVTKPGRRGRGISTFIVENPSPGLVFTRNEEKMGLNGTTTNEIQFENVEVPVQNRLGGENVGFYAAMSALEKGRVAIAAVAVGLAQSALEESVGYAKERVQFGQAIAGFQGLQFMIADMAIRVAAARELVHRAAVLSDQQDESFGSVAAMAKCLATDAAMETTTDAVQVFGGAGYIRGTPVERLMRDAKILQIFEGTNQIMRVVVARSLFGRAD
jgi:alkylation response protein AidB-like acyl-CoA dehydrogenase